MGGRKEEVDVAGRDEEPRGRLPRFADLGKGETERAQQDRRGREAAGEGREKGMGRRRWRGGGRRMVGGKQGWVTGGRGGRRRVGQDWEAKCRRPNNGQAASTDLPTPPPPPRRSYEASTCFPSVPRISGLQFAPHCPLRVIHTRVRHSSHRYSSLPPPPHSFRTRSSCRSSDLAWVGGEQRKEKGILWILFFSLFFFPRPFLFSGRPTSTMFSPLLLCGVIFRIFFQRYTYIQVVEELHSRR